MSISSWVQATGSQALQKLGRVGTGAMDKLTTGPATPSHLPQQPLVQKLEVSPAQVRQLDVSMRQQTSEPCCECGSTTNAVWRGAGRLLARIHAVPDPVVLHRAPDTQTKVSRGQHPQSCDVQHPGLLAQTSVRTALCTYECTDVDVSLRRCYVLQASL